MTREEAKHTLIHIYRHCMWAKECEEYGCAVCEDALNMAIEALSAEATYATCATCAENASCIMAEPDGKWKACKDYRPSPEAVQGWIPFTRRPMTEEEQEDYPDCTFMFDCVLPDDGDEILVSSGRFVWMDTFCNDDGCYLDGGDDIDEDMAWMPLPKPYKGGDE